MDKITEFYALEGILVEHCNGVMNLDFSILPNGNTAINLSDGYGEVLSIDAQTITEAIEKLEQAAQNYLDDWDN